MKTLPLSCLVVAVAGLLTSPVFAAEGGTPPGFYVGGGALASFQQDADAKLTAGGKDKVDLNTGWGASASAGYAWEDLPGFRTEAEVAYRSSAANKVKDTTGTRYSADGSLDNVNLFVNGVYDIATGTPYTPYVGAGVGVAFVNSDVKWDTTKLKANDTRFAYQGIVGVSRVIENTPWSVTLDYRYVGALNSSYKAEVAGVRQPALDGKLTDNTSHNVMLGLRYAFGSTPAPVPELYYVPPAAVAVPAAAPSYVVFFDFNKSVLTPEAKKILADVAKTVKAGKKAKLNVTGHTDTAGTAAYNKKLSARRASAVKAELVRLGVPAKEIRTAAAGETAPLVPTTDGVREAQNRRAELVLICGKDKK